MKAIGALITSVLLLATTVSAGQSTFQRGSEFEISLIGGPSNPWGIKARDADHATVAMNDSGDIAVAYHSTRDDFSPNLKQVEIAYFEFAAGAIPAQDTWTLADQVLVGSVDHSPLSALYPQVEVKCERPDVIAVGNRFFVVWTRRYDRDVNPGSLSPPPQWQEPAVLECAWLEYNGTSVEVFGASLGLGHPLDANYKVRECAGVPDAVVLKQAPGGNPTVGVVYPRQIDFDFDPNNPADGTRIFEMAMVTCSIDPSTNQVASQPPSLLPSQVPYDGPSGNAAGLVLPDLAPSSEENAFWLTYEGQQDVPPNVLGVIRLEYWKLSGSGLPEFAKTFTTQASSSSVLRRRPMIASLPGDTPNEVVSISFNKISPGADSDVVYEQWQYDSNQEKFFRSPAPLGHEFQNGPFNEGKPVVLHGPTPPYLRRCYFNRSGSTGGDGIIYYDLNTNLEFIVKPSATVGRPAVSYNKPSGNVDSIALTWEDLLFPSPTGLKKRIVLRVD